MTAAALAASAGGAVYKGQEAANTQNDMIAARNAATNAEVTRDKAYGDEARGDFAKSLGVFDPAAQANRLVTNQTNAGTYINSNAPTNPTVGTITTTNAPAAVGNAETTKLGDVFGKIGARNTAHGNLAGYDQTMFDNNVDLTNNARKIDSVGDFAKVSAGVNKSEQDAAARNAYRNPSPLGDILQTAGQVGAFYGGKGGFGTFGTPTGGVLPGGLPLGYGGIGHA